MIAVGSGADATISQLPPKLVFVVTVRNNAYLLDRCLRSVATQTYPDTRCIVIDDGSDDETPKVAQRWAAERPDVFTAWLVGYRRGKMANFFDAVTGLDPHTVVVELDGDDRLVCADAAVDLVRLHMRMDLVWTQHRIARHRWRDFPHFRSTDLPPAYRGCRDLPRLRWSRTWHPSHLRSFKAWAFHQIKRGDLMLDGDWVQASPDYAYFTPLVEMTPPELRYFYDRELAVYNITNANEKFADEARQPPALRQSRVVEQIAGRDPYRCREAPLWVGNMDNGTQETLRTIWDSEIAQNPAARLLLAADAPIPASWHPRVQIIGQYTIACSGDPPGNRSRAALDWLTTYAAEFGHTSCRPVPGYLDLPLRVTTPGGLYELDD